MDARFCRGLETVPLFVIVMAANGDATTVPVKDLQKPNKIHDCS